MMSDRVFNPTPFRSRSALWPSPLEELEPPIRAILENRLERAHKAFAEDYKGVTTDGTVVTGLFPIQPTGHSLQPVVDAAKTFLASLSPDERKAVLFDVGSSEWRKWSNAHPFLFRHGVCLYNLNDSKREKALAVVRASVSEQSYEAARNVMKLSEHLRELTGRPEEHDEWYYFFSVFGEPSATAPWGWQIDGHHLIINCFILGDQIVLSPHFVGGEPVHAKTGKYAGTRVLREEEALGHALMSALTPAQRDKAAIKVTLPSELFTTAPWDNHVMKYEGIRYEELSPSQRTLLLELLEFHVGRIRPPHAGIKLSEVKRHLSETRFAWIGPCDDESPFYYRVHSPVILIEFIHQRGVAFDNTEPTRNHAHSIVRTPNGNDYGRALLQRYFQQAGRAPRRAPSALAD